MQETEEMEMVLIVRVFNGLSNNVEHVELFDKQNDKNENQYNI